jgi:hypothetical protein
LHNAQAYFAQSLFTLSIPRSISSSRSHSSALLSLQCSSTHELRRSLSPPPLSLVLFIRDISSGLIHPPPAAASSPGQYSISSSASSFPSASISFVFHQFAIRSESSPPFSVTGFRRVVSVKGSTTGVRCNGIGSCSLQPAGQWN